MFGMGMGEILLIAVVALLVVGPDRLPSAAKAIGKGIRDLRASTKDLQSTIEQDSQIGAAVRELKGALRGDPETLYKRATGEDFHDPPKDADGKDAVAPEFAESVFPSDPNAASDGDAVASADEPNPDGDVPDASAPDSKVAVSAAAAAIDDTNNGVPSGDPELGALLDQAYANSNDPWGTEAVNPHEAANPHEAEVEHDPDLPVIKQPSGAVARGAADDSDSNHG